MHDHPFTMARLLELRQMLDEDDSLVAVNRAARRFRLHENTFYHGTVLPLAKEILQKGLRPNPDQKFIRAQERPTPWMFRGDESGKVFVTRLPDWAKIFAQYRAKLAKAKPGEMVSFGFGHFIKKDVPLVGGTPAIVEFTLPPNKVKTLKQDPEFHGGWTAPNLSTRYVQRLHVLVGDSWIREEI